MSNKVYTLKLAEAHLNQVFAAIGKFPNEEVCQLWLTLTVQKEQHRQAWAANDKAPQLEAAE